MTCTYPYLFSLSIIISCQNILSTLLKKSKIIKGGLGGRSTIFGHRLAPPPPPLGFSHLHSRLHAREEQGQSKNLSDSFVLYPPLTLSLPPTFPIHSFTSWHFPFTHSPGGTLVRASRRESMQGMAELPPRGADRHPTLVPLALCSLSYSFMSL